MNTAIWPVRFGGSAFAAAGLSASSRRVGSFLASAALGAVSLAALTPLAGCSFGLAVSALMARLWAIWPHPPSACLAASAHWPWLRRLPPRLASSDLLRRTWLRRGFAASVASRWRQSARRISHRPSSGGDPRFRESYGYRALRQSHRNWASSVLRSCQPSPHRWYRHPSPSVRRSRMMRPTSWIWSAGTPPLASAVWVCSRSGVAAVVGCGLDDRVVADRRPQFEICLRGRRLGFGRALVGFRGRRRVGLRLVGGNRLRRDLEGGEQRMREVCRASSRRG